MLHSRTYFHRAPADEAHQAHKAKYSALFAVPLPQKVSRAAHKTRSTSFCIHSNTNASFVKQNPVAHRRNHQQPTSE